jgi:hypothetical protein
MEASRCRLSPRERRPIGTLESYPVTSATGFGPKSTVAALSARRGVSELDGKGETVGGIVVMLMHSYFCRINQSLRVTHPIRSGVTDHV